MPRTPADDDPAALERFIAAQEGVHDRALAELRQGRKQSHWMWFVFPQLRGLGQSRTAWFYGIEDADEARRYLVEDLLYSQALNRIGFVKGVGASSKAEPRLNLVGDPYYTDGLRAVMFFEPRPYPLSQVDVLDWERVPSARPTLQKASVIEREERR